MSAENGGYDIGGGLEESAQELAKKWRNSYLHHDGWGNIGMSNAEVFNKCADELESLLIKHKLPSEASKGV